MNYFYGQIAKTVMKIDNTSIYLLAAVSPLPSCRQKLMACHRFRDRAVQHRDCRYLCRTVSQTNMACNLWLTCDGVNPVLLRIEGNLQQMKVTPPGKLNPTYVYIKPYIYLNNIAAAATRSFSPIWLSMTVLPARA